MIGMCKKIEAVLVVKAEDVVSRVELLTRFGQWERLRRTQMTRFATKPSSSHVLLLNKLFKVHLQIYAKFIVLGVVHESHLLVHNSCSISQS